MTLALESRLSKLVEANSEENRYQWATRWKVQARPVAGILCSYVPREVVYAAGFLPWRVTGAWKAATLLAPVHRPSWSSPRNTRILELVLSGDLDFVDIVIGSDWDIDLKRLWDEWTILRKPSGAHIMFVPRYNSEVHWGKMRESIAKLLATLEDCGGVRVSPAGLEKAVQVYRRMRQLIRKMYELRKREEPALSGAEVLGVTTASLVMPPEEFNAELEALLPLLEDRRAPLQRYTPRLLVSSEFLDDTRYLKLVEEVGCVVAMDDLDTGSRLYWSETEASQSDPLLALAIEYLKRPGCPRMSDWEGQIRQVQAWVAEFHIDGVLELGLNFSMSRHFRSPLLKSSLEESGIPFASVPREYQFANESQLRTRIGAFVELLEAQNGS